MNKVRHALRVVADAPYRLAAIATVAAMAPIGEAAAQQSAGAIANQASQSLTGLGNLLLGGAFLGGVGLCGAGLLKVKKAADSDGREPYGPGIWRLGVGGGLVALPSLSGAMRGTLFDNTTAISVQTGSQFRVQ